MRTGHDAAAWARAQVEHPTQDWERLCLSFVRQSFGLDYPPTGWPPAERMAGVAWDRAKLKHRTTDPHQVPAFVPVFWELASVADHVAFSLPGGLCLSNDVRRTGRIDVVRIDAIGPAWGGRLLGWTEDLIGQRVWSPKHVAPEPPPAPVRNNVTRARAQLGIARRNLAIAERYLSQTPEQRQVAHAVGVQLDELDGSIEQLLRKLPTS